ncbi:MAG: MFS transporter [Acidimicrobiales bacterium]
MSAPTAQDRDDGTSSIVSPAYIAVTIANLTVVALAAFDGLAIVAALPSIAEDLGDVALLPWVITAYLGTSAVAVVVAGPVVDAIGVRRTFQMTGVWFLATSAAAAVAPTLPILVAARALQGLGGGLIISVALAAVGLAYPHRLRSRAFAANSLVWGLMGFGGPALAAGLLSFGDWRLLFAINLPLGAVALAMGWRTLPTIDGPRSRIVVDWPGIAMLSILTATSLAAVAQVGVNWAVVAAATIATAVVTVAYWHHSGRAAHPVLERGHLTRFPMRRIHVTSGLVLIAGLAANNYLPLYVQVSRGRSEAFAAFSVVFLTVGWTVASLISAKLMDRRSEAEVILLGGVIIVPSVAFSGVTIAFDMPLAVIFAAFFVVGMGIGFVSTAGLTLLQASSEPAEIGRVNAAHQFIRTLCITYAVAAGGAILLLVVDYQVGDVEVVRDVLAGEDVALGPATAAAVGDGVVWVTALSFVASLGCLWVAWVLARRTRALRPVRQG